MPSRKITLSSEAERIYLENLVYLEKRWGQKLVVDFLDTTDNILNTIAKNPTLFSVSDKFDYVRVCVMHEAISVYYTFSDTEVFLITFWNTYQDPKTLKL